MKFQYLDFFLKKNKISFYPFNFLKIDTNPYKILAYQPIGQLKLDKNGFKNNLYNKFINFIKLSKSKSSDLVISPEYSCPKKILELIIKDDQYKPDKGRLWALGCEALTKKELLKLTKINKNVHILYDKNELTGTGNFLDAICYVFQGIKKEKKIKKQITIMIFQFKTQHSGVWSSTTERDYYIKGENIYVFRNKPGLINFFTLICSEAIEFKINEKFERQLHYRWTNEPFIILNIQLNPKPRDDQFINFRKTINKYNLKEIITINWAQDTKIHDIITQKKIGIDYSYSNILFPSTQLNYNDNKYLQNYKKGVYYFYHDTSKHIYIWNNSELIYEISNLKLSQSGLSNSLSRRDGIRFENLYTFRNSKIIQKKHISNELSKALSENKCRIKNLINNKYNYLDKERLVNLSIGNIACACNQKSWSTINNLQSLKIQHNELLMSFITCYVFSEDEKLYIFNTIKKLNKLDQIRRDARRFPDIFRKKNIKLRSIQFPLDNNNNYNYNYNLLSVDQKFVGLGIYLDAIPDVIAKEKFDNIKRIMPTSQLNRIFLWYSDSNDNLQYLHEKKIFRINAWDSDPVNIRGV